MGHEGHESHEQHTFTSPYPCGVAGLVKKRAVSGCARTPLFSTTPAAAVEAAPVQLSPASQVRLQQLLLSRSCYARVVEPVQGRLTSEVKHVHGFVRPFGRDIGLAPSFPPVVA